MYFTLQTVIFVTLSLTHKSHLQTFYYSMFLLRNLLIQISVDNTSPKQQKIVFASDDLKNTILKNRPQIVECAHFFFCIPGVIQV